MANLRTIARLEPEAQQIILEVRDADSGNLSADYPTVAISIPDLQTLITAEGLADNLEIKFRKHQFKNAEDSCNTWAFIYLGSAPFADP